MKVKKTNTLTRERILFCEMSDNFREKYDKIDTENISEFIFQGQNGEWKIG